MPKSPPRAWQQRQRDIEDSYRAAAPAQSLTHPYREAICSPDIIVPCLIVGIQLRKLTLLEVH